MVKTDKKARKNDAKLEAFAQELAKGKSAAEAARAVGYGGSSLVSNAKRRAQNPIVRKRVAELRALAAANTVVTVERLIDETEEARLMAMTLEEPGAANQCIQTKAKLSGLWRDKVALTDPSGNQAVAPIIVEIVRFSDVKPAGAAAAS